jgi:FG-GAP-like repeat/FG-GAP repeat
MKARAMIWTTCEQTRFLAVALLFLLSGVRPANSATVGFQLAVSYPVGTAPQAVASGDFNGDSNTDLAVVNNGNATAGDDGNVSILLGNGDGTFQSASTIAAGKNPFAIAAADFDGDGRADLVVIDSFGVGVLLGNGDGTFQTAVVYGSGGGIARSVAVGDVNGDGKPDLLVANPCYTGGNCANSTVGVLLGNGDGTFQTAVVYGSGPIARSTVAVGDVNGDGKMDLISCSVAHILVLLGNGDGTFQSVISSQGPLYCNQAVVADFNQDGKPDVAVGVGPVPFSGNFGVVVMLGNGDGTFQAPPSTDLSSVGSVVVADFNGDNKPDLLGASQGGGVSLSLGNGDGTFQAPSSFAPAGTGSPMAADLNHDKAPDLVVTNLNNNTISVLLNTTGADFSISASSPTPGTVSRGQSSTSTITLGHLNAFDNPVALNCSVQPAQSAPTCSLNPNSVTFDATGAATATLIINTGAATALLNPSPLSHDSPLHFLWLPVVGFALMGVGLGSGPSVKRKLAAFLVGAILFGGLLFQAACGGGSSPPGSTTYTITVTGTSGSTQHSTTTTLTVQ